MYTTRVNTYLHTEMWRWHTVHKLKYHKLPIWQQPTLVSYLLPSDAELMEKTSPTAGLFSSWLRLRHKAAPSASRLFSVTHGSTIRLLCLQKKSLPLTALLWDCQHERGGLSIKMTGMSGVYSEQELRISSASFFFLSLLLMNTCRRDKTHSVSHCLLNLSLRLYYKDTQWRVLNAVTYKRCTFHPWMTAINIEHDAVEIYIQTKWSAL